MHFKIFRKKLHTRVVRYLILSKLEILSIFQGFLNIDHEEVSGNQGLKDQVAALIWIKENIEIFGGDPNNITIFGVSAGGLSAHLLMMSPLSKGLTHLILILMTK